MPCKVANILYIVYISISVAAFVLTAVITMIVAPETAGSTLLLLCGILLTAHLFFWLAIYVPLNLSAKIAIAAALKNESYDTGKTAEAADRAFKNPGDIWHLIFAMAYNKGGSIKKKTMLSEVLQIFGIFDLHLSAALLLLTVAFPDTLALYLIAILLLLSVPVIFLIKDKSLDKHIRAELLEDIKAGK